MARVLIVDDEEIARLSLADILRLEGYEISTASGGREAVEMVRKESFDVMILDLKMPGMGGIEVLERIEDKLGTLKVIVLTAHGSMDSAISALRYRVYDYLLKPVMPDHVIDCIEGALVTKDAVVPEEDPDRPRRYYKLTRQVTLDANKRMVTWGDEAISLTPTEARLMVLLTESAGEMLTHTDLVQQCQGYNVSNEEAAKILRPVVSRLRQKMVVLPGWTEWIQNIRGAGYVLELPAE